MSDKANTIHAALAAAQAEMGKALKQSNNPHFKSKYADLANVIDACMPALNAHGIAVIQPTVDDETGRYVETVLLHKDGESLRCRVPLIVQKNDMQGYGSAVTYARRYGLMCMTGIALEDDDGNAAAKAAPNGNGAATPQPRQQPAPAAPQPTPDQVSHAVEMLTHTMDLGALQKAWGMLPGNTKRVPAVAQAKEARKAQLEQPEPMPISELIDDELPY